MTFDLFGMQARLTFRYDRVPWFDWKKTGEVVDVRRTTATLVVDAGDGLLRVLRGVVKCSPRDQFCYERGRRLALRRLELDATLLPVTSSRRAAIGFDQIPDAPLIECELHRADRRVIWTAYWKAQADARAREAARRAQLAAEALKAERGTTVDQRG